MTKQAALFAGLLLSGLLAAAAGCGGDGTSTSGAGGGGGDTGSGGSGGGSSLSCADYCTTIMAGCTADNAQYPSQDSCLNACAGFPAGTAADMGVNSLGCRTYHAGVADDSATNATAHCHHAGPSGGDSICGGRCDGFCSIAMSVCPSAWMTADECNTDCMGFMYDAMNTFDVTNDTSGNTFNCRLYHLTNAAVDATSAMTHCPHITAASGVCM